MKKSILLLASIVLLAASCEKDGPFSNDGKLPAATTSGKNTFGCKINGKVWLPSGGYPWESPVNGKHDRGWVGCDQLFVSAIITYDDGDTSIHQEMILNAWCPVIGENEITPIKGAFTDFNGCGRYRVDTLSPHILVITKLDTANYIGSGTFEFKAINDDCKDTLVITEGRFDVDTHL
jgi:hypothetical protein